MTLRQEADLKHAILAALLFREDLERLIRVARRDDAVGNFARDDPRSSEVARGGQGDKIAERGHAVRTFNAILV